MLILVYLVALLLTTNSVKGSWTGSAVKSQPMLVLLWLASNTSCFDFGYLEPIPYRDG